MLEKASCAFSSTRINTYNSEILCDEDFLPSTVQPAMDFRETIAKPTFELKAQDALNIQGPTYVHEAFSEVQTSVALNLPGQKTVHIVEIHPFPKCIKTKNNERKTHMSEILSSTPVKTKLEDKEKEKKEKEQRKTNKKKQTKSNFCG